MIRVTYYPFGSNDLAHQDFTSLAGAHDFALSLIAPGNDRGRTPAILYSDGKVSFRAIACGGGLRPIEWSMSFPTIDCFRSRACSVADGCGIRYRSRRKGYRASTRALGLFIDRVTQCA
jgi:hypothetical protein